MTFPNVEPTFTEEPSSSPTNAHTIQIPIGVGAGELLLLIIAKGGDGPATQNAVTGWTELVDENLAWGLAVMWHKADGTEGGTTLSIPTTGTATRMAGMVFRITYADPGDFHAPEISAVSTGTSDAPNPDSITPSAGGDRDYLYITGFTLSGEEADDDTWTNNPATNYHTLHQKTSGTGGIDVGAQLAICRRQVRGTSEDAVWPAGSTDNAALTWRAFTIAVYPKPENPSRQPEFFELPGTSLFPKPKLVRV